jgi:methionyl-tRNA formyltransferase
LDSGPLLIQEKIKAGAGESVDELYLKIVAVAARLLSTLILNIEPLFMQKNAQVEGSYWPEHTSSERTIVAHNAQIRHVVHMHRKFGMFGISLQLLDGSVIEGTQVTAQECSHDFLPGTVIGSVKHGYLVALSDGLLTIRA